MLRPYQSELSDKITQAWERGARDVLGVLPCGGGKSVLAASFLKNEPAASVFIAHRAELVSGESLALARNGVRHRIVGQKPLIRECSRLHISELHTSYVDPNARVTVASVDTLINYDPADPWFRSIRLAITDECAHLQKGNKWGRALDMFPNARGLGLTATPCRADGRGLGRDNDGVFDVMVEGPTVRDLILTGSLTPYRIYAPPSDLDLSAVPVAAAGDYSPKPLAVAVHKSGIVGDVVAHYLRLATGLQGMTFCVDVESATETAAAFRAAGIPAEVVTGKTPPDLRNSIFRRFRAHEIRQLVGVDVFGEGTDVPDVGVISLARPTESYSLFVQQIGRVMRLSPGKVEAIVIDHVGNTLRHCTLRTCAQTGKPYISIGEREWTLDRRERGAAGKRDNPALRVCPSCLAAYERVRGRTCPYCSATSEPAGRSSPDQVDGDLSELDPSALAGLQAEIDRVDGAAILPWGAAPAVQGAVRKRHGERQEAQEELREAMSWWGGAQTARGIELAQAQRAFWLEFGVDVMTAQALGRAEAEKLLLTIRSTRR
jgi:DNA repair protein RadD